MATLATADAVISLADLKTELGITAGDAGFDSAVTGYRLAALRWVRLRTRRSPVVSDPYQLLRFLPCADAPLVEAPAYDLELSGATPIRYWTPDRKPRQEPDGTVEAADLGRTWRSEAATALFIHPPAGGWPESMGNGRIAQVMVRHAWDLEDDERATIRAAVTLYARGMFTREERHLNAAEAVIRPVVWI